MQTHSYHILVIEDEPPIQRFLKASLTSEGYRISEANDGQVGIRLAASQPPDLIILDLGLPDMDGQDVLKQLREWYTAPIIVLSARDQESQKVEALDHGADDYVTKPFGVSELLARIRTAMRHNRNASCSVTTYSFGEIRIDLTSRLVSRGKEEIHLTPIEYKLLVTMLQHRGKVLTHRFLLKEVWGPQSTHESHYLRVFVASLRRKLEDNATRPQFILTEQGVGYRIQADHQADTK
jgi:two-component system, OmpR family, KDP operon response regulator KdpE